MSQVEPITHDPLAFKKPERKIRISDALPWCFLLFVFGVPFSIATAHIALGLWAFFWIISLGLGQIQWKRTPLDGPVLIFLGVDLLTGLLGINPANSLLHFVSLWHVLIYFLVVNTISERHWLERSLVVLFVVAGLNATYGLAQYFSEGFYFFRDPGSVARFLNGPNKELGTFSHSMTFAGQMLLVAIMGVSVLFWWKKSSTVRWLIPPVIVILLAWMLSYTRNVWVGGIIGLMALSQMKGRWAVMGMGLTVTVMVGLMYTLQPAFEKRVRSIVDPALSTNIVRINMARVTLDMVKDTPLFGVGAGNYGQGSERYRLRYNVLNTSHPHNNLFTQVAEKGILGLTVFLYLWYVFFREAWFAYKSRTDGLLRALAAGGMVALAGFHIAGMFEANFNDSEVRMMMWLMVGYVMWVRVQIVQETLVEKERHSALRETILTEGRDA